MSGLKRSTTIKDYSSFVGNLKASLVNLQEDMKLQVYDHYHAFVEAYAELESYSPLSTKPYEQCLDSLQTFYDEIQATHPIHSQEIQGKSTTEESDWEEMLDELEALVTEKRFGEACNLVETVSTKELALDNPKARLNFDIQALRLIDTVASLMVEATSVDAKEYVKVLKRLNAMNSAKEAFCIGKSKQLKVYLQRIEAKEPQERVTEIAKVFFTHVRNSLNDARELLSETSGVYFWAILELKHVAMQIGDNLYLFDDVNSLLERVSSMFTYCRMLESDGLSLGPDFERDLAPYIFQYLQEHVEGIKAQLESKLTSEMWKQQVVQLHTDGEVLIVRMSGTCASLHKDISSLFLSCTQLLPDLPILCCELVPKVMTLIQSLLLAYVNSKVLANKKKAAQLIVVCCDLWNMCGVVKETQWKLESFFDPGNSNLFDAQDLISTIKTRFRTELSDFFSGLYSERVKNYLSSLEGVTELSSAEGYKEVKCGEVLSVLKELHSTLSSSTDHNAEACTELVDTVTNIWVTTLDTFLFEAGGYWNLNSKK